MVALRIRYGSFDLWLETILIQCHSLLEELCNITERLHIWFHKDKERKTFSLSKNRVLVLPSGQVDAWWFESRNLSRFSMDFFIYPRVVTWPRAFTVCLIVAFESRRLLVIYGPKWQSNFEEVDPRAEAATAKPGFHSWNFSFDYGCRRWRDLSNCCLSAVDGGDASVFVSNAAVASWSQAQRAAKCFKKF